SRWNLTQKTVRPTGPSGMEGEEQLLMSDSSIKLSHREENVHVHRRMVHRSRKVPTASSPLNSRTRSARRNNSSGTTLEAISHRTRKSAMLLVKQPCLKASNPVRHLPPTRRRLCSKRPLTTPSRIGGEKSRLPSSWQSWWCLRYSSG